MTSSEFVIWLKGFISASNNYNLTPSGWETLKAELEKVNDNETDFDWSMYPYDYSDQDPGFLPANEELLEAAQKYKEWLDKSDRPTWYSTSTNNIK